MTEYLEKYTAPNDEGEPYGGGELCSQCGELYGNGATYFDDGRVVCEECEGAHS